MLLLGFKFIYTLLFQMALFDVLKCATLRTNENDTDSKGASRLQMECVWVFMVIKAQEKEKWNKPVGDTLRSQGVCLYKPSWKHSTATGRGAIMVNTTKDHLQDIFDDLGEGGQRSLKVNCATGRQSRAYDELKPKKCKIL